MPSKNTSWSDKVDFWLKLLCVLAWIGLVITVGLGLKYHWFDFQPREHPELVKTAPTSAEVTT